MIRVERVPEPPDFDEKVRRPGSAWLAERRAEGGAAEGRPRDYWTPFRERLAEGFRNLCAYHAMRENVGTVDHFRSVKKHPQLAYEWSNYRFASGLMNQVKKDADVLDPHEVGEGWFEISLPSLQLVATDKIPAEHRELALHTLRRLRLDQGEAVIRCRQAWYELHARGRLSLEGLYEVAPLIAAAVEKQNRERGRAAHEALRAGGPTLSADPSPEKPSE
ncbi:MAG TPA: hypothetical protein VFS43_38535 [Polyangiaceae bacterium]|nr:hypothetical protein [Polyangiaceae bacterium]